MLLYAGPECTPLPEIKGANRGGAMKAEALLLAMSNVRKKIKYRIVLILFVSR